MARGPVRRVALAVAIASALAALSAGGCAQAGVRPAPFRARPDSVAAGDLRGPFEGRVIDVETGRGIAGAQVYAVWSFVDGFAFNAPAGAHEWLGSTDAQGRYQVPRFDDVPRGKRLAAFRMVVFKRGFVAYRSDRRFEDFGPRLDFTQRHNEVALERWRSDLSHVKHLRYAGGGGALYELTRWEVPEAAAELAGRPSQSETAGPARPNRPTGPVPPVQRLIGVADIKAITGYQGVFDVGDLGDEELSERYANVHFRAAGKDEDWDVAIRVWNLGADADAHFTRLAAELPGVKETEDIPDRSLRAVSDDGKILGVAFFDKAHGVVILVQCGTSQCKSGDVVVSLAEKIKERLDVVFPLKVTP